MGLNLQYSATTIRGPLIRVAEQSKSRSSLMLYAIGDESNPHYGYWLHFSFRIENSACFLVPYSDCSITKANVYCFSVHCYWVDTFLLLNNTHLYCVRADAHTLAVLSTKPLASKVSCTARYSIFFSFKGGNRSALDTTCFAYLIRNVDWHKVSMGL